jgi:hypothetical protein
MLELDKLLKPVRCGRPGRFALGLAEWSNEAGGGCMYRQGEAVGEVGKKRRALLCWRTGGKQGPGLIPRAGRTKVARQPGKRRRMQRKRSDKYLGTVCSGWLRLDGPATEWRLCLRSSCTRLNATQAFR